MGLSKRQSWWLVFLAAATPFLFYLLSYLFNPRVLGVDPVEVVLEAMGTWALRFLILTLACSSLYRVGIKKPKRFRRMLGLYCFFYASLHLLTYVGGWLEFDLLDFTEDVSERPFIYLGMIAWFFLSLLALTSPKKAVRLLKRNWVWLHRMIYVIALLAIIHLWMQQRASAIESIVYGSLIALLLGERLIRNIHKFRLEKRTA